MPTLPKPLALTLVSFNCHCGLRIKTMEMLRSVGSDGQLTLSASGDQLNYIDLDMDMRRGRIVVEQCTIRQQAKHVDPCGYVCFGCGFLPFEIVFVQFVLAVMKSRSIG